MSGPLRVLVVEDEPVAADAHTAYVGRVEGFEVAGDGPHRAGGAAGARPRAGSTSCCWT